MTESDRIVELLSADTTYPNYRGKVEIVETHISWVFLTDRFAYKLKKPVQFEFVDFSTPELRHHACLEELRLNRRLAPDVYIAVLPVTQDKRGALQLAGDGTDLDWVVQMRRLPANMSLEVVMQAGRLRAEDASSIASHLAKFFANSLREPLFSGNYRHVLEQHIRANCETLLSAIPAEQDRIHRVRSSQLRYLIIEGDMFDRRERAGRIIDGHGDLRPEHIYLEDPPVVIDCIEFSDELRKVDVADELSFLAMECQRLGNEQFGELVILTYQKACEDRIPLSLLAFYRSYRACVRAKVSAIRAQQRPANESNSVEQLVRTYLALAGRNAAELGPPSLIFVGGLMGTGKSTLAEHIARAFGVDSLSTDRIRRSILGASQAAAEYGQGLYASDLRIGVYDELFRRASDILGTGQSVVLDGTFLARHLRDQTRQLGEQHAAATLHVLCECSRPIALARIQQRASAGQNESEGRTDLYDLQARDFEPLNADEPAVKVDTAEDLPLQLRAIYDALRTNLFQRR